MKKSILLLVFIMLFGARLMAQTPIAPSAGDGSSGNPYQIETWQNLYWISQNPGYWDKNYIQTANIDLSTATPSINTWDNNQGWTPIGKTSTEFYGSYNGDGYTIKGLYINREVTDNIGLFGYTASGTVIKNIGITSANVTGGNYLGILVGYNFYSTITNCYSIGSISGNNVVGGLIGFNYGTISNCFSGGNSSGASVVGGLIGYDQNGTITNCYSISSSSGTSTVGGLIGYNGIPVLNCYSTGSVTGTTSVGGLIGQNGGSGSVSNSFWDTETSGQSISSAGTGKSTAEMKTQSTFIVATWDFKGESTNGTNDVWNIGNSRNNDYPYLNWQYPSDPAAIPAVAPTVGNGLSASPYQIGTWQNLYWLSQTPGAWGLYFIQTANIDLSTATPAINTWDSNQGWTPIGNNITNFTGSYNGDGHTISGLNISRSATDNIGLFGYSGSGSTIKNLGVLNTNITGKDYVGSLIGRNLSTITNCYSTGSVSSTGNLAGGLIGHNSLSTVTYCYSTGSVSASGNDVGGLIGVNSEGTMSNCFSTCNVIANGFAGGLLGINYWSTNTNCYSTGNVSAGDYVGGLYGQNWNGNTSNCYSTGSVTGTTHVGGMIGSSTGGSNTNCFWDTTTSGQPTSSAGTGKTTAQMKSQFTYTNSGWDFRGEATNGTYETWNIGNSRNNDYPYFDWQYSINPAPFPAVSPNVGDGSSSNPYQIATWQNLYWLSQTPAVWRSYFIQTANIDLSAATPAINTWDSNQGWTPIGNNSANFTGSYNGNGHTISGLYISRAGTNNIGLFGLSAVGAVIGNLGIISADITGASSVGGLIGSNSSIVSNCYSTGSTSGTNMVGGLIGISENTVSNCYSTVSVSGVNNIGGLMGFNGQNVTNCYSTGSASGIDAIGGLIGYNGSAATNCYSTASVTGTTRFGGLFGFSSEFVSNCFWDKTTSGQPTSPFGTGKTTAEMKTQSTFTSATWDFKGETANGTNDVWNIGNSRNNGYPFLNWQYPETTIYVKASASGNNNGTSWTNAYTSLQSALSAATTGDQIWVAAGTYYPTNGTDRSISFNMKNDLAIYGGFAGTETQLSERNWTSHITMLSGDIGTPYDNTDNSFNVVKNSGLNNSSILDGFHIRFGNEGTENFGGGLYNSHSSPILANLIILGNFAYSGGGIYNEYSSPTLTNCTIQGNVSGGGGGGGMYNFCSSPLLINCTISGSHSNSGNGGGGMYNSSSSPTLENCTIKENFSGSSGGGIKNELSSSPILTNCIIQNNIAAEDGGGLYNNNSSPNLTNCLIINNSSISGSGGGVINTHNSSCMFTNCTVSGNFTPNRGGGVYNSGSSSTTLNNSIIWGNMANGGGKQFYIEDGTTALNFTSFANGTGDVIGTLSPNEYCNNSDPKFINPNNDFRLAASSPCIDTGNDTYISLTTDIRGTGFGRKLLKTDASSAGPIDMGAYEFKKGTDKETSPLLRFYVKVNATGTGDGSSWANAYTSLKEAITAAGRYYEIWVAAGIYKPTTGTDRNVTFNMKNDLAIYGGFSGTESILSERNWTSNVTILSGDIGTSGDNTDNSYHVVFNTNLNITAILDGFTVQGGYNIGYDGSGIYNLASSPTLANCIITGNYVSGIGGGVCNRYSSPILNNCVISNNTAKDWGGGVYNYSSSSPMLNNCIISGNSASWGGGMDNSVSCLPLLTNCIISGNSAEIGGGMSNRGGSSPTMNNCTISGNSATSEGGGLFANSLSPLILNNSIVWGNSASNGNQISSSYGSIQLNFTCYANETADIYKYGGTFTPDANCITSNPQLVNTASNDFRILGSSPCKDKGNNSYNSTSFDIRGQTRVQNTTIDMGAYEWTSGVDPGALYSWTGAISTNWNTASNWAGGSVPISTSDVIIPDVTNDPVIGATSTADCHNLTVNSGASLTIESTGSGTGSLIVTGTPTGNLTCQSYMTTDVWHMVSSPVSGQTIASFLAANSLIAVKSGSDTRAMKNYLEATDAWSDYFTNSTSGSLGGGKGFSVIVWATTGGTVSYTGALQNGDVNLAITRTPSTGFGWNLVGNPYSSAIAINTAAGVDNFINNNCSALNQNYCGIYYWNGSAYVPVNLSDGAFYAQVGQGFFVKSKTGGGTISFTPSMQTHRPTTEFKKAVIPWPEIKLVATHGDISNNTVIRFNETMNQGLDIGYDAGILKSGFDVYTKLVEDNGVDFGIQCLPLTANKDMVIPIGLESSTKGSVTLSLDFNNFPSDCQVTFEDRETGMFTPVSKSGQIANIQVDAKSKVVGRFFLHTSYLKNTTGITSLPEEWRIYVLHGQICISGSVTDNTTAAIYDLLGRKVGTYQLQNGSLNHIPCADFRNGVYLINIRQQRGTFTKKISVIN